MPSRLLLLASVALSSVALAQNEEFTPPPMLSADQPVEQPPVAPNPQQPQYQPYPQQQYPQQQYPQQQYPQQQQQPYYQQRPQPQQNPAQQTRKATTFMESTKTKHFVGLLSGSVGLMNSAAGVVGSARGEFDISRFGFLAAYNAFLSTSTNIQVHQFNLMAGWAFFTSDELTLRALAGVDIMTRDTLTAAGPMFGVNVCSMFGRVGIDGAVLLTVFPFRQLEARAAFVVGWSIFELHLGWRLQIIDATQSGTIETLFTTAPGINGPVVGIGITL